MACCATSTRETAAAAGGSAGAADRLQLSGPLCGGGGSAADWRRPTASWPMAPGLEAASAIRRCRWRTLIEINALTLDGADGPQLTRALVAGRRALLAEAQVRDLAQRWFGALEALVRHAAQPGAGGRTPVRPAAGGADAGRDRAAGAALSGGSRTSCRCRRCRRGCCSTRCTTRRRPTSTRCSSSSSWRARSTAALLQAAVQALVRPACEPAGGFQHEELSRPVQVIVPRAAVPWRCIDLSVLGRASGSAAGRRPATQDRASGSIWPRRR